MFQPNEMFADKIVIWAMVIFMYRITSKQLDYIVIYLSLFICNGLEKWRLQVQTRAAS